mgnify:CR=1 FL=1
MSQRSRADDARFVAQPGGLNHRRKPVVTAEAIGCHILPHGREQPLALTADAAADEHHLRPQNVHQIGDACGHIDVILRQHRLRRLIAAVRRVKHVLGGEGIAAARQRRLRMRQSCPPSLPDQSGGGAVGLPAAFTSAGARLAVQYQYGMSRLGAGAAYGEEALKVATTVKLTRALWIIPLSLVSALIFRQKGKKIQIPWFIFWFVVAMLVNTYCNLPTQLTHGISVAARCGLSATLFLIGGGLSIEVIRKVGLKPLVLGIILWAVISVASLAVILLL